MLYRSIIGSNDPGGDPPPHAEDAAFKWLSLMLLVLIVLALAYGCGYANAPSSWPARGPFVCVQNGTDDELVLMAKTPGGSAITLRRIRARESIEVRWPFVHYQGQLLAGPYYTPTFEPWSSHYWYWYVQSQTVKPLQEASRACRG